MTMVGPKRFAAFGNWTFTIVWAGQLVSNIGSGLTRFALAVWIFQTTGSITKFTLIAVFSLLPTVLLSPFAGALVDRWDRRRILILADSGGGFSTLALAILFFAGHPDIRLVYLAVLISATFSAVRWPALTAATTQLVPERHFGRANGLMQIVQAGQVLISPLLAGVLIAVVQVQGVVLIDFATFAFALLTLASIRIPRPEASAEGQAGKGTLIREAGYGWSYIRARSGLFALMLFTSGVAFLVEMVAILAGPLILAFSSPAVLGRVMSIGGIGYLAGAVAMSAWGGPKRRVHAVLGFTALLGVFSGLAGLRSSIPVITVGVSMVLFCLPIILSASGAIWQSKVAPDVQGRVFAFRRMIVTASQPLAALIGGPVADRVFEPLLRVNGSLAGSVGTILGVGPGRGIGLLYLTIGLICVGLAIGGYLYPRIRLVEDELPDRVGERAQVPTPVPAEIAGG